MSTAAIEQHETTSPSEELWSVAQGEKNGQPLLIRFRNEPPQGVDAKAYPLLLSCTWSYRANGAGMPDAKELERMTRFEEAVESALEGSQSGYLMVVLTGNGDRDWLFYSRGEEESMRQVNQGLKGHPVYPVEFSAQRDPQWRAWRQFLPGGNSSGSAGGLLGIVERAIALVGRALGR